MSEAGKVTYISSGVGEEVHAAFNAALRKAVDETGGIHSFFVDGQGRRGEGHASREVAPGDSDFILGTFCQPSNRDVDDAVAAAVRGQRSWAALGWAERVAILRRAAAAIAEHRFELAALVTIEIGKPRLEALGDVDETIELVELYCRQAEEREGFRTATTPEGSGEEAVSLMRPYGAWVVIAPFNFPVPLAVGPAAAALLAGNSVVLKPAFQAYLSTRRCCELLVEAGVPTGALHLLFGDGARVGERLVQHPDVGGITFTGSHAVGMGIHRDSATRAFVRPVVAEMGGKNATIVATSARVPEAAEGVARAAFGYSGQKCSACSRVYVTDRVADEFIGALEECTAGLKVANPVLRDAFTGPLINGAAVERYVAAVEEAKRFGRIVVGGDRLAGADTPSDQYVSLAVAEVNDPSSRLLRDELFVPFVAVHRVRGLPDALELVNSSDFGLTAGIFTQDPEEIEHFFEEAQAGVLYANRAAGATTGAWPGVQTFGGWKGSGTTGRGTGGSRYVEQYLREQSRTIMRASGTSQGP
jgi:1-pyrroline-5-carboxylate dehydrogenase